jgi:hypothetical protein
MTGELSSKASPAPGGRTARVECNLDNDSRLLASLGVLLSHAARQAGLPEEMQQDFVAAAESAWQEIAAEGNGAGPASTHLVLEEFSDRLEMNIDAPDGVSKHLKSKINDRIHCELHDGRVRITMLKPHGTAKSGSAS